MGYRNPQVIMYRRTLLWLFVSIGLAFPLIAQQAPVKITASDGDTSDAFGLSVAVDGEYALIGATGDDDNGEAAGAVYLFKRTGETWQEQAKLTPSDAASGDGFGFSVALRGDYALIGAYSEAYQGNPGGAAYVFKRTGETWQEQAKLIASEVSSGGAFGSAVTIDGDYALVGARHDGQSNIGERSVGAAYIFKRTGETWQEQAKLTASDAAKDKQFGRSVALDGDYALIGSWRDPHFTRLLGTAYVFKRDGEAWQEQARLTASDGIRGDLFGSAVALDGDDALVGAYKDGEDGSLVGKAYVFKRDGEAWQEQARLTASNGRGRNLFGFSVALDGDYALVGAPGNDDKGKDAGIAYLFKRNDGETWQEVARLSASDGASGDSFGSTLALTDGQVLIGALGDDEKGSIAGAAYLFALDDPSTAVEEDESTLPATYALAQNYPNPFTPRTRIAYTLPAAQHVVITVYDLLGREVATLADGLKQAGRHEVVFEAGTLPSGAYFYRMVAGTYTETRTTFVLK